MTKLMKAVFISFIFIMVAGQAHSVESGHYDVDRTIAAQDKYGS